MRKVMRRDRGVILLTATIVLVTMMALGSAFLLSSVGNARHTTMLVDRSRAASIAQAGIDLALYELAYGGRTVGEEWAMDYGNGRIYLRTFNQTDAGGGVAQDGMLGRIVAIGAYPAPRAGVPMADQLDDVAFWTVDVTVQNDSYEIHELVYKAMYAGNRQGGEYHQEFGGVNHGQHDYADEIDGDIHIEGDIWLGGDAHAHRFGDLGTTGNITMLDMLGNPDHNLGGGGDDSVKPPDLSKQGYELPQRHFKSWDPSTHTPGHDVVHVKDEFDYYEQNHASEMWHIEISEEGGWFSDGTNSYPEWNDRAWALPDSGKGDAFSPANFIMKDYQNHFVDTFDSNDDTQMEATGNYYLGQRNGGDYYHYGDDYELYGGGHSVITVTPEMNNKVYLVDGNLWVDSDGSNHVFFVPGDGVDKVNITIVAKGNIYIGDQIFTTTNDVNQEQYSRNIGGWTSAECYDMTDPESGIALLAMKDGESYNDLNKNGKYDPYSGETIVGREDPNTPVPADHNGMQAPDGYAGRMEGSGNIIFGDTICGPVGVVEAFMFAENNFLDITADTSQGDQNPYLFGNMTAGNRIYMNRNTRGWLSQSSWQVNGKPDDWTYSRDINGTTYYFPPGTNDDNWDNPFVTYRRLKPANGNKWDLELSEHNPLNLKYDTRMEEEIIDLPGLPYSNETHEGSWKIIVWRQMSGHGGYDIDNWGSGG